MKTDILSIRIPKKLKNKLIDNAHQKGITLSENVNLILMEYTTEPQNEEIDNQTLFDIEFSNSNEFIYLTSWVFDKIKNPYHDGGNNELEDLKTITLEVIKNNCFPFYLRKEFEKVLFDLLRVINENESKDQRFKFCELYSQDAFDYTYLRDYLRNRAFENRINL